MVPLHAMFASFLKSKAAYQIIKLKWLYNIIFNT